MASQPAATTTPAITSSAPPATASPDLGSPGAQLPGQDPIAGVVIHVDSTGLDSVTAFTLRAVDGQTYRIVLGRLQNAAEFPPGHLVEHAANSEPILVSWLALGTTIIATRLEDARPSVSPEATASPGPS